VAAAGTNPPAAAPEPPAAPAAPAAPAEPNPLEAQLEAARAEAAGYLDDLQRLKAEFDNYRKRIVKEQTALLERASASLLHRLLPVLDNFELAVASAEESREFDRMLKGIEMVFGELKEVLTAEGLTAIAAKGQSFDPNYHEAALTVDGEDDGEPYVAEELRSGYTYKGRVLRPSMVKVARRHTG
jgi:molecular chaperone GrpE